MADATLAVVEGVLNRILGEDPDSPARLRSVAGRTLRIDSWIMNDVSVYLTFTEEGIRLDREFTGEVAASLAGGPLSLLRGAVDHTDRRPFSDGTLEVEGDATLVKVFSDLFRLYAPDWQRRLSPLIGDALTWRIETLFEAIGKWRREAHAKFVEDAGDYLREEVRLLAGRVPVSAFSDQVDDLVSDAARLEQRIALLERKLQ